MHLKCPCGTVLAVEASAAGMQVRCPKCQTLLQVPGAPSAPKSIHQPPSTPKPNPASNLQSLPAFPPPQSAPVRQPAKPGRTASAPAHSGKTKWIAIGLGAAALLLVATVAALLSLSGDANTELQESFEALPTKTAGGNSGETPASALTVQGRNAAEEAMLAVANKFVELARVDDHHAAISMIDVDLFHARLHSETGSYEAIMNDIPAKKLLANFAKYSLNRAKGGVRHWDIIGVSTFEGRPGVVVRYFIEPTTPANVIGRNEVYRPLVAAIQWDEFAEHSDSLLSPIGSKGSGITFKRTRAIDNVNTYRIGYMMLVFDTEGSTPRLADLVNVLGNASLIHTGAFVFLDDYYVIGGSGKRETFDLEKISASVYGIVPQTGTISWPAGDKAAEEKARADAEKKKAAVAQLRPSRLAKLMHLFNENNPQFATELDRFRADFPGDLGIEMAVLFSIMSETKPAFSTTRDAFVDQAADALFQKWRDPFFLYARGLNALAMGRNSEAESHFKQCRQLGFETAEIYGFQLAEAANAGDKATVTTTLAAMNRYWRGAGAQQDEMKLAKFKTHWDSQAKSLARAAEKTDVPDEPQTSIRTATRPGMTRPPMMRPGQSRPSLSRPGSRRPSNTDPSATAPSATPPTSTRPGPTRPFGPPRIPPPGMNGPKVVIKISSDNSFKGNELSKALAEKLGVSNYGFSQSGNRGTLTIGYDGPVQTVADAIDFGTVQSSDEQARTLTVTIP